MSSVYDFEALSIDGQPVALSQFRGQPLLIVNTASACGRAKPVPRHPGLTTLRIVNTVN
jgi:glutathione peroxidase-family protein